MCADALLKVPFSKDRALQYHRVSDSQKKKSPSCMTLYLFYTSNRPTISSKAAKEAYNHTNPSLIAPKPDVTIARYDVECIGWEIKKPNAKCIAVYNDLAKLANELKHMLDRAFALRPSTNTCVAGILVQGMTI